MLPPSIVQKFALKIQNLQNKPNPSHQETPSNASSSLIQQNRDISLYTNNDNQGHNVSATKTQCLANNKSTSLYNDQEYENYANSSNIYEYQSLSSFHLSNGESFRIENKSKEYRYEKEREDIKKISKSEIRSNISMKSNMQNEKIRQQNEKKQIKQAIQKELMSLKTFFTKKSTPKAQTELIQNQTKYSLPNENTIIQQVQKVSQNPQQSQVKIQPILKNSISNKKQHKTGIFVYMMNNLLYLHRKISPLVMKSYIKQLAKKHRIPFHKLLIYYGIEELLAKFYQTHDIESSFNQQYLLSELQLLIPNLIFEIGLTNWHIIRTIIMGVFTRFKISKHYNDEWLINCIKKKRKFLKQNNIKCEIILGMAKGGQIEVEQQPTQQQMKIAGYTTLTEYIAKNKPKLINAVQIQDTDSELLENSERQGIESQLNYYKKMKEKIKHYQKQPHLVRNYNKKEEFVPIEFEIIKMGSKLPKGVAILQYQESNQDIQQESQQQGLKYYIKQAKMKQKTEQNRKRRQREILKQNETKIKPIKVAKSIMQQNLHEDESYGSQTQRSQQFEKQSKIPPKSIKDDFRVKKLVPQKISNSHPELSKQNDTHDKKYWQQMIQNGKILKKLESNLYQFYKRNPEFTVTTITSEIQRILKQDISLPTQYHQQIELAWLKKFIKK